MAVGPPQSTPVSEPFLTPSVGTQVGARQVPPVQTPLTQLAPLVPHILPSAQGGQSEPPQPMSVSEPFRTVSPQEAATHRPIVQTPLTQSVGAVHPCPAGQRVAHMAVGPPQSTPVSEPFLTPSVGTQLGARQVPPVQTPLVQFAALIPHIRPLPQGGQPPPQLRSVSVPLRTMSVQSACWQMPPVQTPLVQLAPLVPHPCPSRHRRSGRHMPPQLTSVSVPFLMLSAVHDGGLQVPFVPQTPLTQSSPPPHPWPSMHRLPMATHGPPQSMPVSVSFLTPSMQLGGAQMRGEAAGHEPLMQSELPRHCLPLPQTGQEAPPQSMSVSVPLRIPSVQLGAWQSPPMQFPLWQSTPIEHGLPGVHWMQPEDGGPQSIAVSMPFLTLSVQVAMAQALPAQTRLEQSPAPLHRLPMGQPAQGPPQSTSLSALFLTLSMHVGTAHLPPVQTPLTQSPATTQIFPSRQGPQAMPPQSTSVSVPFSVVSAQPAPWQRPMVQTPATQSIPVVHILPVAHFIGHGPPQSTSGSAPLRKVSVHVGP
jgi:hypothetical protein